MKKEEILTRLHENHPSLIFSTEDYQGIKKKMRFECTVCGEVFYTTPNSLTTNSNTPGCPKCSKTNLYNITTKKHNEFLEEMKMKNTSVEVLGQYKNNREHIKVKCLKCGHTWGASPFHLLEGHGCPECGRKRRIEALRLASMKKNY